MTTLICMKHGEVHDFIYIDMQGKGKQHNGKYCMLCLVEKLLENKINKLIVITLHQCRS